MGYHDLSSQLRVPIQVELICLNSKYTNWDVLQHEIQVISSKYPSNRSYKDTVRDSQLKPTLGVNSTPRKESNVTRKAKEIVSMHMCKSGWIASIISQRVVECSLACDRNQRNSENRNF